jgi:SH3-like domain-containing protein
MGPILSIALMLVLAGFAAVAQPTAGPSGLPLPRFVSLAESEVNARTGPGREYPIKWIYTRRDLPVKIVEEFDVWRKVQDQEGDEAWMHAQLLTSKRTVVMVGTVRELRRTASDSSRVVLRVEPGVVAGLLDCTRDWCLVEVAGERGWVNRGGIWGVLETEMQD